MSRLVLVSGDGDLVTQVRETVTNLELSVTVLDPAADTEDLAGRIVSQRPSAVLLGPDLAEDTRRHVTVELDADHPGVVVLWLESESPDTIRAALRAGARDLVPYPGSVEVLRERIAEATGISTRRRQGAAQALESVDDAFRAGRVITVVSPKGGSGKTMFSTNLSVGLNQLSPGSVALVDLDLQFGDIAAAFGTRPEYSVVDVLRTGGDATTVKSFLAAHQTGVFSLAAPTNAVEAEDAKPDSVAKLLHTLAGEFRHVVVDTGAGLDDVTLTAIEEATDVVFITTVDVASIHALRKAIVVLDHIGLQDHRRFFMLNRANSRTGLSRGEIEEVTGLAIDAEIPSHRSVSKALNDGTPLLAEAGRSKVGRSLASASKLIFDAPTAEVRR